MSKKDRARQAAAAAAAAATARKAATAPSAAPRRAKSSQIATAGAIGTFVGGASAAVLMGGVAYVVQGHAASASALQAEETLAALVARAPCAGALATLDLRHLRAGVSELPARLRCPVLLRGVAEWCGTTAERVLKWDWDVLAASDHEFEFDVSETPEITYWDNNSLFATAVREGDVRKQMHTRVTGNGSVFAAAVRGGDGQGWARYGGALHGFSPAMARQLKGSAADVAAGGLSRVAPFPWRDGEGGGGGGGKVSLWAAAAGVTSSAHFDSFDNTHVLLAGRKRVLLAPPAATARLGVWPSTHPHARQAHRSLAAEPAAADAASGPVAAHELVLSPGEALFIPAGWVHEMTAVEPACALSLTSLGLEFHDFNRWATTDRARLVPFMSAGNGRWDASRLAAALAAYVPALLDALGLADRGLPAQLLAMYSASTRAEMGLPPRAPWKHGCAGAAAADAAAAAPRKSRDAELVGAAVAEVAARFELYEAELLPNYVLLYLENVLPRLGSASARAWAKPTPASMIGAMLDFVESCLVGDER